MENIPNILHFAVIFISLVKLLSITNEIVVLESSKFYTNYYNRYWMLVMIVSHGLVYCLPWVFSYKCLTYAYDNRSLPSMGDLLSHCSMPPGLLDAFVYVANVSWCPPWQGYCLHICIHTCTCIHTLVTGCLDVDW